MTNRDTTQSKTSTLLQKAVALLEVHHEKTDLSSTEVEMLKLIHELKVHQIELEQQNEELKSGKSAAQEAVDLYDFAPTGYFTLSQAGKIIRLNLCGAKMLGKERGLLENSLFCLFVADESKAAFNLFLEKVFKSKAEETCKVEVLRDKNLPVYLQLKGVITQNRETCLITSVDITEIKQAEDALRENEKRLNEAQKNAILNRISANIAFVDKDLKIIWANKAAAGPVNKTAEEMIGKTCYCLWADPSKPCKECPTVLALDTKKTEQTIMSTPDGKIWTQQGEPIFDTDVNLIGVAEIATDIAEFKKFENELIVANKKLLESQKEAQNNYALLNSVFESPQKIIIFSLDKNYCYTAFSDFHHKTMKKIWGVEIEKGMNMLDAILDPVDREKAKNNFDRTLNGEFLRFEEEYGNPKFYRTFYENFYNPIFAANGDVFGIAVFVIDISERKYAAELLEKSRYNLNYSQQLAHLGSWEWDMNSNTLTFSDEFCRIFGLNAETTEINADLLIEFIHPDDRDFYLGNLSKSVLTGQSKSFEYRIVRPDGTIRNLYATGNIICDENNKPIKGIGAIQDITERKEVEIALRESEEKFRTIAETSPLAIYISSGIEQKAEYVNQTFVKMFGYSMADVPTVGEWWPLAYPDGEYRRQVAAEWQKRINIAIENHSEIEPMDTVVICKDGSRKNIQWGFKTIGKQNWAFGLDLTERIHTEIENQKTQKLLEDSQKIGKIGGWEYNIDTKELKWTKEMYNIHEVDLTFNPSVDKRFQFYTAESLSVVNNAVQRAIEFGEPYEVDSEIISAKGNRRAVKAIGRADLENRRVFGLFQDITERKRAKDELLKTNLYLENLINYANAPIIVWDPQFRITRFNHAFEFLTGRTEADVIGKSLDILFPPELSGNSMALIHKTLMGERWETVEIKIQHLDNSVRTLLWNSATLFMPDGKTPIATIAQGHDITIRKQMEEKLRESSTRLVLATQAGGVGIWDYDIVNNVLEWDDQMFSLYGITKSQFGSAFEAWLACVHPDSKAQGEAEIQMALNGEKEFDTEFKVLWSDGSVHDIRALAIVLRSDTGKPLRMIGTNWDITRQKKAEAEIKQRNEELRNLNATKDKFFSIIAHDLKSPFNSILGFGEMLKNEARGLDIDSIEQYAGIIISSAQHTFELLENLLDWARMQQGRIPFEPKPLLFNDIVHSEFERLKETANKKSISLIDGNQGNIILTADENMLRAVIRNLISNAIKFTMKTGFVKVSAELREEYIHIMVSDSGIGINPETTDKLFKIETSFTTRGTENEKGTGLGLLLCKEFIEKHGGEIWVESEKGKGSTFSFSLPADPD